MVTKNKHKTIYADVMRIYREDEDYCCIALNMLKHAIADMDTDAMRDAYDKLTKCFDDLIKTTGEISIRFREASEILDNCLDSNRLRKEKNDDEESSI